MITPRWNSDRVTILVTILSAFRGSGVQWKKKWEQNNENEKQHRGKRKRERAVKKGIGGFEGGDTPEERILMWKVSSC